MNAASHMHWMLESPVRRLILRLAIPTIASMLISAFYNVADAWFVGRLDTQSVAAVGIAFPAMALIQAIGFFFGHGSGNTMARMLGAEDVKSAQIMAATGVICSALCGLLVAFCGLCFHTPMASLMGATDSILPYAAPYLLILSLGAPAMCAALTLNNQLRFQGRASLAMIGILSGAVLNCFLDPLFIFVFGWGVSGAAFATVCGQILSLLLLWKMNRQYGIVPIQLSAFQPSRYVFGEIIRGGTPSLFRQGLGCFAMAALNHASGVYGDAAIAAMGIVTRLTNFLYAAIVGFGQGFQPVCGFAYGAKRFKRVCDGFWFLVQANAAVLFLLSLSVWIEAPDIIARFHNADPAVTQIGTRTLRWQMITLVLSAWIIPCNMMMQTIRKSVQASLLAAAKQGLFLIPLLWFLPSAFGLSGLVASQAVSDGLAFLLSLPLTLPTLFILRTAAKTQGSIHPKTLANSSS